MALNSTYKRGTALPDSDVAELNRMNGYATSGWIISGAIGGANATQVSISAFGAIVNGVYNRIAASNGTAAAFSGTLAASTTGAFVMTVAQLGTLKTYVCSGTTGQAISLPTTIPTTQAVVGFVVIACTATAFNGGTNSLADSSYTVSVMNIVGPTGFFLNTTNYTLIPG